MIVAVYSYVYNIMMPNEVDQGSNRYNGCAKYFALRSPQLHKEFGIVSVVVNGDPMMKLIDPQFNIQCQSRVKSDMVSD